MKAKLPNLLPFIVLLLWGTVLKTQPNTYQLIPLSEMIGTWNCAVSDNGLSVTFNSNNTGTLQWQHNGTNTIQFQWAVNACPNGDIIWLQGDNPTDQSIYCQIMMNQTSSNVDNPTDDFQVLVAFFTCDFRNQNLGPRVMQYTRMWEFVKQGGQPNCNYPVTANADCSDSSNCDFDQEIVNLLHQLQMAFANHNTGQAQSIENQILAEVQQAYPNCMSEIQDRINQIKEQQNGQSNNNNQSNNSSEENPEGWSVLYDFQNLLNEYISIYNSVINGGDINLLLQWAEKIQAWMAAHADAFGKLTKAQMDLLEKMMKRFMDMILKGASPGMPREEKCNYVGPPGNWTPDIKTGGISFTPTEKAPSAPMSNDGVFEKGGNIGSPAQDCTGNPNSPGMERPKQ